MRCHSCCRYYPDDEVGRDEDGEPTCEDCLRDWRQYSPCGWAADDAAEYRAYAYR
jgi:hypothetical protein